MKLKTKLSAALPFAHLLGLSAAKAEDDEMKQGADESDEDYAKRMEDGDKKQRDGESDEDYAKRMEDEEKKQRDGESDEDYAKRMAADDDEAGDEDDDKKEQAVRHAERQRCAAIFGCAAAGTRPDVAAHLAFTTDMSSADAIKMLTTVAAGGAPASRSLANRMAKVNTPNVGASGGASRSANSAQGVAAQILAAGKKRRGEA